jgi:hypothetical protein
MAARRIRQADQHDISRRDAKFIEAHVHAMPTHTTDPARFLQPGQIRNEDPKYLQLKIGCRFKFGNQSIEPAVNIFNAFNTGANTQWNTGANQTDSPNYLARFNRHPPRSLQLSLAYKF